MDNRQKEDGFLDIGDKSKEIMTVCKKCGSKAPAKEFRIHDDLGIMVCPNCFRRTFAQNSDSKIIEFPKEIKEEEPKLIFIHSEEDIERRLFEKKESKKIIEREKDKRIIYICDKCSFKFKYSPVKDWPIRCPGCSRSLKNIRTGNRLIY